MPYLIDGHNLIHYLSDIQLDDPHDEAKLVLKLRGFCARTRKKCVVIFDEGLPGGTSSLSTPSVKVVFAASRQSNADRIIRERIHLTRDVRGWIVVSSDNEILEEVRSVGMRGMKCFDFAEILMRPIAERPHRGLQENVMVSEAEIAEFLALFGVDETDESEIQLPDIPGEAPPENPLSDSQSSKVDTESEQPQAMDNGAHPNQKPRKPPQVRAEHSTAEDVHVSDKEVNQWLDIFGEEAQREPTDKAPPIQARTKKRKKSSQPVEAPADENLKEDKTTLSENSVTAWLDVFGGVDTEREPTDPAPQRSDPHKQGRYKNKDGKREPTVHKRMATSDEIYLSDGEVDAWMEVFGIEDEEDK